MFLMAVFRGRSGLEQDSVLVGATPIQPDAVDFTNVTDYDCYRGRLIEVRNMPPWPDPARDPDQTGRQVLFGPAEETDIYYKVYDSASSPPAPSSNNFDFRLPTRRMAEWGRFVFLHNKPTYRFAFLTSRMVDTSNGNTVINSVENTPSDVQSAINRYVLQGDRPVRVVFPPNAFLYRGSASLQMWIRYINPEMRNCIPDTGVLQPNHQRLPGEIWPDP
jgi:hypothetical protein